MSEMLSVNDIEKMRTENTQLKNSIMAYIEENQKLITENKELKTELQERYNEVLRLQGMIDAFEICVKARK